MPRRPSHELPTRWRVAVVLTSQSLLPLVAWLAVAALAARPALRHASAQGRAGPVISMLFLALLWQLDVPSLSGPPVHLLGTTAATLICGPALAFFQVSLLAFADATFKSSVDWSSALPYALLAGAAPAWLTARLLRQARRRLPPNVFVFIFINAFLAAGITMAVFIAGRELLLGDAGSLSRALELSLLLAMPEALITGTVIAPLVAFRSHLVHCFDADRYFGPGIR